MGHLRKTSYHAFAFMIVLLFVEACTSADKSSKSDHDIIMKLGDTPVYTSDFAYIYHKNNSNNDNAYTEESVREYLDLYTKFKLKVLEAERLGLDTTASFKKELKGYKKQLAEPYLNAKDVKDSLVRQAYERMKTEVDASHILISVGQDANPEDTLKAYKKAQKVRELAMQGESFKKLARNFSDDPSAKRNGGHLGYFSALQMVYPFENAAYNTPEGGISKPVRTKYGYHIIKVHDKRPSRGKVKVAHIMVRANKGLPREDSLEAVKKINKIHDKLQNDARWGRMVQEFSEDKRSKNNDGKLPEFTTGQMIPEFENAAFALEKPGTISKPVRTPYGWHIIKLIDKKPLPPFEEIKSRLEKKVEKDSRSNLSKEILIKRLKEENSFKQNEEALARVRETADKSLVKGKWSYEKDTALLNRQLFQIDEQHYLVRDFFDYVKKKQRFRKKIDPERYMNMLYEDYADDQVIAYEKNHLAEKYEDYRMLVQEYRDGILLFDLMDRKVWSKAVEDTSGLEAFYDKNKDRYQWGKRARATLVSAADKKVLDKVKERLGQQYYKIDFIKNDTILFTDKFELQSHDSTALNNCYKQLSKNDDLLVEIAGAAEFPKEFDLVFTYLNESKGVDSSRMMIKNEHHPGDVKHDHEYIVLHYYTKNAEVLEKQFNQNNPLNVNIDQGKYEKGDHKIIDSIGLKAGAYDFTRNGRNYYVKIHEILEPAPKPFKKAKGTVISDYQNHLEKQWVDSLKQKYPVKIYDKQVEKVINRKKKKETGHSMNK